MSNVYEMPFKSITVVPGEDLTKHRYHFVALNKEGLGVKGTAGAAAVGIIQEPNNVNQPANVMVSGVSYGICEDTIDAGDEVEVGTDGKCKKLATGKKVGYCVAGGAAGEYCSVLIG